MRNGSPRILSRGDHSRDVEQSGSQVALDAPVPDTSPEEITSESGQLWADFVPQEVVDGVRDKEKMRQCIINEVISTERDFVRDLEYLRDSCIIPLRTTDIIPEERRVDFVQKVFWNIEEIIDVNTRLRDLLTKRQKTHRVVATIGDIFLELFPSFVPFVQYIEHQRFGEYELEKEKASNPSFAAFVEAFKHLPASRKLELNGYLVKPLARLKRYPSLLETVLSNTEEGNADWVAIPRALELVRNTLKSANDEYIKTEDRLNLLQLGERLVFKPGEEVDLNLMHEQRKLVYKGILKRRGRTTNGDRNMQVSLLDHALVVAESKMVDGNEQLKVIRRPIPLELLAVSTPEELSTRAPGTRAAQNPATPKPQEKKHWLVLSRLGKWGYSLALSAPTAIVQRGWVDHIAAQLQAMREQTRVFETFTPGEGLGGARVNCVVPYGKWLAYGTGDGVFFGMLSEGKPQTPVKVLDLPDIQQVDMLEAHKLLVIQSGK
ncbi:RHO1 GDP-GTP exchange protein 2 [Ceratobasidium sp. 394]|nr:RHO1 GDP-GTP exchange protein 2 [Ceratobasidium sp. 394]